MSGGRSIWHPVAVGGALALAGLAASPAAAQDPGSRPSREFVQDASQSDQFEMLEAQTVLGQSTDQQVRAYAEAMIRDHSRTSEALRQAASRAGLKLPAPGIGADQAQLLAGLQSLRGPEFEQTYLRHQTLSHRSALLVEQRYAADGDAAPLRQAAAAAVPVISSHLDMAQQMRARQGGS